MYELFGDYSALIWRKSVESLILEEDRLPSIARINRQIDKEQIKFNRSIDERYSAKSSDFKPTEQEFSSVQGIISGIKKNMKQWRSH